MLGIEFSCSQLPSLQNKNFRLDPFLFPSLSAPLFSNMDSFAWHEAEISRMKATAARFDGENLGTDLSSAKQHSTRFESDYDPPQSGFEAQRHSQLAELMPNLDPALADKGNLNAHLQQQTQELQNVKNQAPLQTSHHAILAPEHNSRDGNAALAGATVAEKHLDDENGDETMGSEPSKASLFAAIGSCENCRRIKRACDQGRPGCGRCGLKKVECIYASKPDQRFRSQLAITKEKGENASSTSASTTVAESYPDDEKYDETTGLKPSRATSCVRCQRIRRKCDQGQPSCGGCELKEEKCIYLLNFNDQRFYL